MFRTPQSYFPILNSLKGYSKRIFLSDLSAGAMVGIMLIPQGMAYAFLAGMPPVYGLYGGLIPLVLYALLGTSRQMSIGPVAISALLVLAGVSELAEPFSPLYIKYVILAGLIIGIVQVTLGMMKAGRLAEFISHPVISGFTSAAAIIIAVNQLKDVLGIKIPNFDYSYQTLLYVGQNLERINWIPLAMTASAIIIMIFSKILKKSFPGALVVTILSILITWMFNLHEQGLEIVGTIPQGLPSFYIPTLNYEVFEKLMPVVFTVTVIGIVESFSIAKVLEGKHHNYHINPNQELIALGVSKIGGAFFQSLPTSGSFTRSAVNNDSGAQTTISSIIAASLILLTLLFLTPLFYFLPKAILAAIILMAVRNLFDYEEAIRLWKIHRIDLSLMLTTFFATLLFGIEEGVFTGILLSILNVLYRSSKPNIVILGNIPGTTYYRNIERFEEAEQIEGKLIIRFENQIYFGNASYFKESIRKLIKDHPEEITEFLLDAKSVHYIDSSGLLALRSINKYLERRGIHFTICGAVGVVRDQLEKSGFLNEIGDDRHFIYLHHAVEDSEINNLQTNTQEDDPA